MSVSQYDRYDLRCVPVLTEVKTERHFSTDLYRTGNHKKRNFSIAKGKKKKKQFFVVNAVNEFVIWQIMQSINGRN